MLKSANLLHKCGLGDSDMNSTVIIKIKNCTHLTATVATPRVSPSCQPKSLIDFDIEKY